MKAISSGWLALGLALAAESAHAGMRTVHFYGYAYELASARYLYTEVHEQHLDGDRWLGGTIRYFAPDGAMLGAKTLDFSADRFVPLYRLELPREHYEEAITAIAPGRIEIEKSRDGKRKTASVERVPALSADSGFNSYLLAHFDELLRGRTLPFVFAVAGQLDSYRFRARKIADLMFDGQPAVRLRVEPDSMLRMFVDPLTITYGIDTRHLLEYRGVSNIHDPASGSAYNVRIVYPPDPPPDAPKNLPPLQ
jgi:hypothetical protein